MNPRHPTPVLPFKEAPHSWWSLLRPHGCHERFLAALEARPPRMEAHDETTKDNRPIHTRLRRRDRSLHGGRGAGLNGGRCSVTPRRPADDAFGAHAGRTSCAGRSTGARSTRRTGRGARSIASCSGAGSARSASERARNATSHRRAGPEPSCADRLSLAAGRRPERCAEPPRHRGAFSNRFVEILRTAGGGRSATPGAFDSEDHQSGRSGASIASACDHTVQFPGGCDSGGATGAPEGRDAIYGLFGHDAIKPSPRLLRQREISGRCGAHPDQSGGQHTGDDASSVASQCPGRPRRARPLPHSGARCARARRES